MVVCLKGRRSTRTASRRGRGSGRRHRFFRKALTAQTSSCQPPFGPFGSSQRNSMLSTRPPQFSSSAARCCRDHAPQTRTPMTGMDGQLRRDGSGSRLPVIWGRRTSAPLLSVGGSPTMVDGLSDLSNARRWIPRLGDQMLGRMGIPVCLALVTRMGLWRRLGSSSQLKMARDHCSSGRV